MLHRALLLGVCLGLAAGAASAQSIELEGRYWGPTLTSTVKVTGGQTGLPNGIDQLDLKSDLGVKDENLHDWRVNLATGPHSRLRVGYVSMDYHGDRDVERTIVFNGQTYAVGTRVLTDLSLKYWRYGWIWQFLHDPAGIVKFGTVVEAKTVDVDAALAAPALAPPVDERKKFTATLPSLGLALDIDPTPRVNVYAEATGISAGKHGYLVDAEGGLKLRPLPGFSLLVGYRYLDIDAKDDPDFAKLREAGPFVGASLKL
ncbi:MAG TPA: hypothetical protein VLW17_10795 [Thermoanaerobaculaceae bacterium]|nr:hypothetical protein [Thermoanaerobaculaceae bacterium]